VVVTSALGGIGSSYKIPRPRR